ncbi:MAG: cell wall-active antibiotics response protein [Flammeovirgaceae bacterium]|nr:cell wall-active antibiotics response protein [Flammeovirgaceae bacterium]
MKTSKDMYTQENKTEKNEGSPRDGRAIAGLIVITVGALLLARQAGADFPHWILSFGTLLGVIGLYIGYRQRFRNWFWMVPTAIGLLFLTDDIVENFSVGPFIWPIIIIAVGLVIIFRPRRSRELRQKFSNVTEESTGEDKIDTITVFGAIKKNIISKNFKGGEATSVFGGVELDFTQADINGRAELELTHIFGGAKLIIPPDWRLHSDELVCIFGGLDDKRKATSNTDPNKVLVITGTCLFGGIDIKSY